MAANRLLDRLSKGPVVCAEGYLFELERCGYVSAGAFVPEVVLDGLTPTYYAAQGLQV